MSDKNLPNTNVNQENNQEDSEHTSSESTNPPPEDERPSPESNDSFEVSEELTINTGSSIIERNETYIPVEEDLHSIYLLDCRSENLIKSSTSEENCGTSQTIPNDLCKISNHSSNFSLMCRICYDDTLDEPIISPCKCKGSVGVVHKSCLEKWLAESNTNRCDLCFFIFETERTTKYSVLESLYKWLRHPPTSFAFPIRDMRSDMITCMILIPFSIMIAYLCLFAAEYYNRHSFSAIPVAKWTSVSVMFMGMVLVLGFCTWIYLVMRYHSRVWYFWWQRETIVRIHVPDSVITK